MRIVFLSPVCYARTMWARIIPAAKQAAAEAKRAERDQLRSLGRKEREAKKKELRELRKAEALAKKREAAKQKIKEREEREDS